MAGERGLGPPEVSVGSKWGYTYTADWRVDVDVHEVKDLSIETLRRQATETRSMLGGALGLYQIHSATLDSGILEDRAVLDELARLRAEEGWFIGLSVTGPRQGETVLRALEVGGFDCVQATWNLMEPSAGPALAAAHDAGLGVIIKEALANGRLTDRGDAPKLVEVARELGVSTDALALRCVLAQPWVDVVAERRLDDGDGHEQPRRAGGDDLRRRLGATGDAGRGPRRSTGRSAPSSPGPDAAPGSVTAGRRASVGVMPLRNRATPQQDVIADPARGLVYANRGVLHDAHGELRRRWGVRRWIACRLEFKGRRRRPLMAPGRYTELFFSDEAAAFAAGHRPCAECRCEDYQRFSALGGGCIPGRSVPTRWTSSSTPSGLICRPTDSAGTRCHRRGFPTGRSCWPTSGHGWCWETSCWSGRRRATPPSDGRVPGRGWRWC